MATTNKRRSLVELIQKHLNTAPESTLEKVLELLEDEEDIRDARAEIADAKMNGTISWDEYSEKQDPRLLKEVGDLRVTVLAKVRL